MPIFVTNSTDKTQHLRSFDGDSVAVHAKTKDVKVARKFNWQVPETVPPLRIVDGGEDLVDACRIVPGRVPVPAHRPSGHHNKSRHDPLMSADAYRERVARLNPDLARTMQDARDRLNKRFLDNRKRRRR